VELQHHDRPDDDRIIRQLCDLAFDLVLPVVASNNVHHATRDGSRLRDALIAIRHLCTLDEARRTGLLPLNSNAYLRAPAEMARIFRERPDALENTLRIAERCQVSLDFSDRRLPRYTQTDGKSEFAFLYEQCHDRLPHRYPDLTPQVLKQLAHELAVIEQAHLAGYFLIVADIVHEARKKQIRCQGRGSAANSIVAYLLGITSIDPLQHNLLFERFLSEDKFTSPDIDLDFAADRREAVIQYVYNTCGHAHTAMVANTITYQARSALRDLAKVLGFPAPVIDKLANSLDTHSAQAAAASLLEMVAQDGASRWATTRCACWPT
jgi:error-prone DNA polymerase